jgi:transcriptional regulator with XRE-family HTH domain
VPSYRPSRDFKASPQFVAECHRFGSRVRELREEAKLTLERASSEAEIDLAHWQKIEAGRVNVTLGTMLRVANAVGAPVEALFGDKARDRAKRERGKKAPRRYATRKNK